MKIKKLKEVFLAVSSIDDYYKSSIDEIFEKMENLSDECDSVESFRLFYNGGCKIHLLDSSVGEDIKIHGFIVTECFGNRVHINDIFISEEHRGKNYGKKLIDASLEDWDHFLYDEDEDEALGVETCTLEVRDDNIGALLFYLRNKFKIVGYIADYYESGIGAIYMRYVLKN